MSTCELYDNSFGVGTMNQAKFRLEEYLGYIRSRLDLVKNHCVLTGLWGITSLQTVKQTREQILYLQT